jgi:hypothetical protein
MNQKATQCVFKNYHLFFLSTPSSQPILFSFSFHSSNSNLCNLNTALFTLKNWITSIRYLITHYSYTGFFAKGATSDVQIQTTSRQLSVEKAADPVWQFLTGALWFVIVCSKTALLLCCCVTRGVRIKGRAESYCVPLRETCRSSCVIFTLIFD